MTFKDFYAEFDRLTGIYRPHEDLALQDKLIKKLNKRLMDMLFNRPGVDKNFVSIR